jgi:dihydroorotate dehydrogenase
LFDLSLWVLKNMRARLGQDHLIIAVGGIDSKERAQKMMDSGANLLQIYTSFIYKGTKIVHKLIEPSINSFI